MLIHYRHDTSTRPDRRGAAVTIGNFDGVHKGHSELFKLIVHTARNQGLRAAVLTFEPHPRAFFDPSAAPARISGLRDRLAWIKAHGIDELHLLPFDRKLASQTPQTFIQTVLLQRLATRHLWVGDDFRFGQKRTGDFSTLVSAGQEHGFAVDGIQSVLHGSARVSSTDIRRLLAAGDIPGAAAALGHPLTFSGRVAHGQKLGRTLGFPTLNLTLGYRLPALSGILAVWVHGLAPQPLPGVASLGVRPSVKSSGEYWLETFVLDWSADVYGKAITIEVVKHIRPEARFDSLDALVVQMKHDTEQARQALALQPASQPLFALARA
jgi:riboflavin kinase/FMN adenylyltransferase